MSGDTPATSMGVDGTPTSPRKRRLRVEYRPTTEAGYQLQDAVTAARDDLDAIFFTGATGEDEWDTLVDRYAAAVQRAALAEAAPPLSCVSCGSVIVYRPDDPVIHVGCAIADDAAEATPVESES